MHTVNVLGDGKFVVFDSSERHAERMRVDLTLAAGSAHRVQRYDELLKRVATLSFHNSRFRLLFRGQTNDYRIESHDGTGGRSVLFPSILRKSKASPKQRFARLRQAERLLVDELPREDSLHLNLPLSRWAILQHYEVCETPLLDVTHSLQVALSFAFGDQKNRPKDDAFLYVLAVPHLTGPVSVSIESMTQTIDLSQLCPPEALRPHFQSGSLLSDYPGRQELGQRRTTSSLVPDDFACRLLTKFHLVDLRKWKRQGFSQIPTDLLFPNASDRWYALTREVKKALPPLSA